MLYSLKGSLPQLPFLLLLILASSLTQGRTIRDQFRAEGTGVSRQEAVYDALSMAISQSGGGHLVSRQELRSAFREEFRQTHGKRKSESVLSSRQENRIAIATEGVFDSFEVISADKRPNGGWRAIVEVVILDYETPGLSPESRRKLAVLPFRQEQHYLICGKSVDGEEASRQFSRAVEDFLTQTRRFALVDRQQNQEYRREVQLILSGNAGKEDYGKLKSLLAADYLLVGNITHWEIDCETNTIDATGEVYDKVDGYLEFDYRVIVLATRQVKWADKLRIDAQDLDLELTATAEPVISRMVEEAARQISSDMLNNIYPISIAGINENDLIILNQGGNSLAKGEQLRVLKLGEMLYDRYTGEQIGREETEVGRIRVERVEPKKSYASVVEGQLSAIVPGRTICRRLAEEKGNPEPGRQPVPSKETDTEELPAGGRILPFDKE